MSDLGMSVLVTRVALGLPDLELNDFVSYYVGAEFLGGQETFQRSQVGSPFLDGQVTTYRQMQNINETMQFEVLADDQDELRANVAALKDAFRQDSYTLNVTVGTQSYQFAFEAGDSQVSWSGPRFIANQLQVIITAQRKPLVLTGVSF